MAVTHFSYVSPPALHTQFPRVEALRAKVRASGFTRASDDEMARIRRAAADADAVNALEDLHPTAEDAAFHRMMDEERLPLAVRSRLHLEYIDLLASE